MNIYLCFGYESNTAALYSEQAFSREHQGVARYADWNPNRLCPESGPHEKRVVVPMITLDQELNSVDEISVLKVDAQGYEAAVFSGAAEVLNRTRVLIVEVTYAPYYQGYKQFLDLWQHLLSIAPFQLWGISAPQLSSTGRPMWADAVFFHD